MPKILAAGDLHLGRSSFSGLSSTFSARDMWARMVEYAVDNRMDIMLLAGDVVDKDNKYFESIGALKQGFSKLDKSGIQVIMISGNHDYDVLRQIAHSGEHPNVTLLGIDGNWEEMLVEKLGVRFVGWSFPSQHVHSNPFEKYQLNLSTEHPVIGILHGDVFDKKSVYAPFSPHHLDGRQVGLWVLGHIHKPGKVDGATVPTYYTGSPLPLSAKETGAHGPIIIEVDPVGSINVKAVPISPIRYDNLALDFTTVTDPSLLRQQLVEAMLKEGEKIGTEDGNAYNDLVLRITVKVDSELIVAAEKEFQDVCATSLKEPLSNIQITVNSFSLLPKTRIDLAALSKEPNAPGVLARAILDMEAGAPNEFVSKLIRSWKDEYKRLGSSMVFAELPREDASEEMAKSFLIEECKKNLTELLKQPANA